MAISQRFAGLSPLNVQQPFLDPNQHPKKDTKQPGSGLNFPTTKWLQNVFQAIKSAPEIPQTVPAHSNSSGLPGQIAYDATHFYVCVAANTWIRFTGTSF
jgi:hypothetical protein